MGSEHSWQHAVVTVLVTLCFIISKVEGVTTASSKLTPEQQHALCLRHVICRDRYSQSPLSSAAHVSPLSQTRFERESTALESNTKLLLASFKTNEMMRPNTDTTTEDDSESMLAQMALYEMLLHKLLFDENRCPPNSYWVWSEANKTGSCRCLIDRDCRAATTTVCHDTTHGSIYWLAAIFIILVIIDILVRIITDRYTK